MARAKIYFSLRNPVIRHIEKEPALLLRESILPAALSVFLVAAGLIGWRVANAPDCRDVATCWKLLQE